MPSDAIENLQVHEVQQLDLRTVFGREDLTFTPWLAKQENLERLSRAIGLDLELVATEEFSGTFYTDILAQCPTNGEKVVIENQFNRSDHDHLGKSLTYLAAHQAKTVVWIAEGFADEHRAALDWLNENTPEDVWFFGVIPRVIRIASSPPALTFEVAVRPNRLVKAVRNQTAALEWYPELREAFWEEFRARLASDQVATRYGGRQTFLWLLPSVPDAYAAVTPNVCIWTSISSSRDHHAGVQLAFASSGDVSDEAEERMNRARERFANEFRDEARGSLKDDKLHVPGDFGSTESRGDILDTILPAALRACTLVEEEFASLP